MDDRCLHVRTEVVRVQHKGGSVSMCERCADPACGEQLGWLTKSSAQELALEATPVVLAYKPDPDLPGEACAYEGCERTDTSRHHPVPVHSVGQEVADRFGTMPLCPEHHRVAHMAISAARRRGQ